MSRNTRVISTVLCFMFFGLFGNTLNDYDKKYESFVKEIKNFNWDDFSSVKSMIQPTVEFYNVPTKKNEIGSARVGGTPDLPSSIIWPSFENKPMVFFAQINLNDLSDYHRNEILPTSGFLYFFSYFQDPENEFGAEYEFIKDKQEYKVIYFDGNKEDLLQVDFPEGLISNYRFPVQVLGFKILFDLPPSLETGIIESSTLSENDKALIEKYNDQFYDGPFDQILGIPGPLQYGVDWDWAVSYLDITASDYETRKGEVNNIRANFVNLLTIPLFEEIGYSQAYFGILDKDLKDLNFNKSVFILQGT